MVLVFGEPPNPPNPHESESRKELPLHIRKLFEEVSSKEGERRWYWYLATSPRATFSAFPYFVSHLVIVIDPETPYRLLTSVAVINPFSKSLTICLLNASLYLFAVGLFFIVPL